MNRRERLGRCPAQLGVLFLRRRDPAQSVDRFGRRVSKREGHSPRYEPESAGSAKTLTFVFELLDGGIVASFQKSRESSHPLIHRLRLRQIAEQARDSRRI